jgi:hypothetical protein
VHYRRVSAGDRRQAARRVVHTDELVARVGSIEIALPDPLDAPWRVLETNRDNTSTAILTPDSILSQSRGELRTASPAG